ncbi:LysM peptidoglycan-binding domain-containing protein [Bacillus sonorensis]|nr:LysM peptidoglycan-binding domain-containing protein [Bacillus sonorensis]
MKKTAAIRRLIKKRTLSKKPPLFKKKAGKQRKNGRDPKKETAQEQPTEDKKTEDKPAAAENKPAVTAKNPKTSPLPQRKIPQKPPVRQAPQPKKVIQHTVAEKETLYRISMKYYKDRSGEEKIRNYNQLSGNNVYAGQVLDIPFY